MDQTIPTTVVTPQWVAMLVVAGLIILCGPRRWVLPTLLVLSGVTDRALLETSDIQADLVFDDVGHLHRVWERLPEQDRRLG
jgi:hypothetical protein